MANIADLRLKITLNNKSEENNRIDDLNDDSILYELKDDFIRLEEICDELHEISFRDFNVDFFEDGVAEISMGNRGVANIEALQNICTNYDCSIIGVAWEFNNDYIEVIDLTNEIKIEDNSNHFVSVEYKSNYENYSPDKECDEINLENDTEL